MIRTLALAMLLAAPVHAFTVAEEAGIGPGRDAPDGWGATTSCVGTGIDCGLGL